MERKYKVAGYVKNALLWKKRNPEEMIAYEYKRKLGMNYDSGFKSADVAKWPVESVIRILKNEMYTGTMVQGKSRKINYKVNKSLPVDKENWIYVEGTHDAIILKEKFDDVQNLMKMDTRTSPEKETVYPLSGYVKCGDCMQNMIRRSSKKKGKKYWYYHCSTYKNGGECTSHMINCDKVERAVVDTIARTIILLDKAEVIFNQLNESPSELVCIRTIDKQLSKLKEEIEYYGTLKIKLYKDMVDGIITKEEFVELNKRFSKSSEELEIQFHNIEQRKEILPTTKKSGNVRICFA